MPKSILRKKLTPRQAATGMVAAIGVYFCWVWWHMASTDPVVKPPQVRKPYVKPEPVCVLFTNRKDFRPDIKTEIIATQSYDESLSDSQLIDLIRQVNDSELVFGYVDRVGKDALDDSYTIIPLARARTLSRRESFQFGPISDATLVATARRIVESRACRRLHLKFAEDPELVQLEERLPQILDLVISWTPVIPVDETPIVEGSLKRVEDVVCEVSRAGGKWNAAMSYSTGRNSGFEKQASLLTSEELVNFFVASFDKIRVASHSKKSNDPFRRMCDRLDLRIRERRGTKDLDGALNAMKLRQFLEPNSMDVKNAMASLLAERASSFMQADLDGSESREDSSRALDESHRALEGLSKTISECDTDLEALDIVISDMQPPRIPATFRGEVTEKVASYRQSVRKALVDAVSAQKSVERREVLMLKALPWFTRSSGWYGENLGQTIQVREQLLRLSQGLPSGDFIVESLLFGGSSDKSGKVAYAYADNLTQQLEINQLRRLASVSAIYGDYFHGRVKEREAKGE